jgi:tRNA nucleotidyltransferase (CCA-adding enzyme)
MEISRINSSNIHPQAIEVCRILSEAGYQAYIVGGCVRDLLLGHVPKDWDITTDASPNQVLSLFPKTIPTGLQHGTVTVVMGHGVENHFEVTTFRVEGEYLDGRRPEEVFFVMNLEQDLARRDLTINAIAYDPIANRLEDPFEGISDLKNRVIKAVGHAETRFREDGLRIMRAARFAARFGYQIENKTFQAMRSSLETLKRVSKERVQDELRKTLMSTHAFYGLSLLLQSGALEIACPILTDQKPHLHFLQYVDKCEGEFETRLATIYANVSVERAQAELLSLKFSNKEIKRVVFLLQLLDRYGELFPRDNASSYKSFMALVKNHAPDPWDHTYGQFLRLSEAIGLGAEVRFAKYAGEIVFSKKEMQLNGNDLLEVGIPAGPRIKQALEECYLEILRHPQYNTKHHLLQVAKRF